MPQLSNAQHESFCNAVAAGYSQTESARRAGYPVRSANNTGARLSKRADIRQRVAELKSVIHPNEIASKQWVLTEAVENHRLARKAADYGVARQCLEFIARLQGFLVERRESYSEKVSIHRMNHAELNSALRAALAGLPAPALERLKLEAPEAVDLVPSDADPAVFEQPSEPPEA